MLQAIQKGEIIQKSMKFIASLTASIDTWLGTIPILSHTRYTDSVADWLSVCVQLDDPAGERVVREFTTSSYLGERWLDGIKTTGN